MFMVMFFIIIFIFFLRFFQFVFFVIIFWFGVFSRFLFRILLFFHFLLIFHRRIHDLFGHSLSFSFTVGDENIVEYGTGFDLPQIETDRTYLLLKVKFIIGNIIGIINFGMNPWAFVIGIIDLFGFSIRL